MKMKVKVAQSCPTLCDPMDYTVYRILQARILEWVAFPFSSGSSGPRNQTRVSFIAGGLYQLSYQGFHCGSAGKESSCNVGNLGLIPGFGRSPGEGNSYPLQYSVLENSIDCIVHGVTESDTTEGLSLNIHNAYILVVRTSLM